MGPYDGSPLISDNTEMPSKLAFHVTCPVPPQASLVPLLSARQPTCPSDVTWQVHQSKWQLADQEALQQMQAFFSRLQDHLVAMYGSKGAAVRAHMLFDACAARNIDPQILFKDDSEGDSWADTIANLSL